MSSMEATSFDLILLLRPAIRCFSCKMVSPLPVPQLAIIGGHSFRQPDILAASCDALFLLQDGLVPAVQLAIISGRSFL